MPEAPESTGLLSEKEFTETYDPIRVDEDGCFLFEKKISDAELMADLYALRDVNIWSITEDDSHMYAQAGRRVNSIGYTITKNPWKTGNEKAVWCRLK